MTQHVTAGGWLYGVARGTTAPALRRSGARDAPQAEQPRRPRYGLESGRAFA